MFERLTERIEQVAERRAAALVDRLRDEGVRVEDDGDKVRLTARDLRWRMTGLKR